jgi:transcriptional regulator GlxA family with amidase domain
VSAVRAAPGPGTATVRISVLAYSEVDDLDLFGAYAVLAKASALSGDGPGPSVDVRLAASARRVTSSGGVTFRPQGRLDTLARSDAVVIPGGRGAQRAAGDLLVAAVLREAFWRGASLYGVCSGAFLIAAAGLARHRQVAVHHGKRAQLAAYPIGGLARGLVRDGRITSVGGDTSSSVKSADLAFQVLADFAPHLLDALGARMELAPGRACRSVLAPDGQQ